jgi:hypothetical protein
MVAATLQVVRELHEIHEQLRTNNNYNAILVRLAEMEKNMAIKVSEIATAVAQIKANNREALAEIGTKIADLNQQIKDLIEGVGDPTVTNEAFEQDLRDLGADSQALADVVPGKPGEPPAE